MKDRLSIIGGFGFAISAIATPVYSQTLAQTTLTPAIADAPPASTQAADLVIPARAGAGYTTSGGGYDGFGSFEGFIPLTQTPGKNLLYLVGRLLLDNDANLGGNVLLGYRFSNPSANLVYGAYLGYDSRNTGESVFSQIGFGFEALGAGWDARVNAYVPVGNTRQTVAESLLDGGTQLNSLRFEGNFFRASGTRQQILTRQLEVAMAGFDGEAGGRLFQFGNGGDVRGYAGLYYLSGGENSVGVRGRLEARPLNFLTLGLAVQHDRIFGTNVIGTIALSFPSRQTRGLQPETAVARLGDMPYRVNAIAVDHRTEVTRTSRPFTDGVLTNPATGQPYLFQHVVLGATDGNGTVENPFGIVQSALNATRADGNDIVYVQSGTNPGIPAFTVPDRVQVLSTGVPQQLPANFLGQFFPAYPLPLSGSGVLPSVTGTVTLRSDTVLSGFHITSATGPGVTFNTVNRVEIRDNIIRNTTSPGILGNGVAIANLFRNQISATQDQGIYLQNVGLANVSENIVSSTRASTTAIANPITGDISIGSITIPNPGSIIPLPSGQGIVIATTTGDVNLSRNTVTGTGTQGIVVLNARGNTSITDNTVTSTVGNPFSLELPPFGSIQVPTGQGIVVAGVSGNLEVSRNAVSAVNGQGIAVAGVVNGTTTLTNNTIRNSADQGLLVAGTSGTTTIANNQISDVSARNLSLAVPPLGIITIGTGQGVALFNAIGTVNVTGNTFERVAGVLSPTTFPGGQGIQVASFTGQLDLNVTNNQIRNNSNDGILIGLAGRLSGSVTPAIANLTITNNTIENNGGNNPVRGDGIAIGLEQDAVVNNLQIANNLIRNNGDEGIDIRLGLQAVPGVNPTAARLTGTIQNNILSDNGQNGVQVEGRGDTIARVTIANNTASNNGERGVWVTASGIPAVGSPLVVADVRLNILTANATAGFQVTTRTAILSPQRICVNLTSNTSTNPSQITNAPNPFLNPSNTLTVINLPAVNTNNTGGVVVSGTPAPANTTVCP